MPTDLVHNTNDNEKISFSTSTSEITLTDTSSKAVEEVCNEEDAFSFNTDQINYRRMIDWYSKQRAAIESTAANGEEKQAIQVNKGRKRI